MLAVAGRRMDRRRRFSLSRHAAERRREGGASGVRHRRGTGSGASARSRHQLDKGEGATPSHAAQRYRARTRSAGGILVNNAAHQNTFKEIDDIDDEEWELTFRVNIHAMFCLSKAAVKHMSEGGSIINTASINSDAPNPTLLAYATTKGAIANFTAGLAQMLAEKGIRVNAVAPGPI